jgi:hypothetical protein
MKKQTTISLLLTCLLVLASCSSVKNNLLPTYNTGGYKIISSKEKSTPNSNELIISGKVYDIKTGKPINNTTLLVSCLKIQVSSKGEYTIKTENSTYPYYFIEVVSLGYKTIQTNFIDLKNKNEITINFYLTEDDRPLINCEGGVIEMKSK